MKPEQVITLQQAQSGDHLQATNVTNAQLSGVWVVLTVSLSQRFVRALKESNVDVERRFSEFEFNSAKFKLLAEAQSVTKKKAKK